MTPGDALRFDGKMPTENIAAMESLEGGAMTPTMLSLLAAIRAHPDEDTPRLAFADAAIEAAGTVECRLCKGEYDEIRGVYGCKACHGFGRVSDGLAQWGEFIRVQVELARASCRECKGEGKYYEDAGPYESGWRKCKCEVSALRRRERELWGYLPTRNGVRSYFESTLPGAAFCPESDGGKHLGSGFPIVLIRRGLPAVVRCTPAEWMGERCERCQGRGHRTLYGDGSGPWTKCQYCVDGRTLATGPRLAQRWPIVAVEVVDITDFGFDSDGLWLAANLPSDLIGKIPNHGIFPTDDGRSFADWLSDALIAWARGQGNQVDTASSHTRSLDRPHRGGPLNGISPPR